MKKPTIMICLMLTILVLTACGGSASQNQANVTESTANGSTSSDDNTKYLDVSYSNALPLSMQLIIGTLKLKGTANEVDADTAKELIPLWKAVKSLGSSDTTSPAEIEALYKQIQRTMTAEQITAISDMKLTTDTMMQISQELGITMGGSGNRGTLTPEQQSTMEANQASGGGAPADGGMMGGGPGGGIPGGGMPGGGAAGQGSSSSSTDEASAAPKVSQVDSNLVEAIIEYLETMIQ